MRRCTGGRRRKTFRRLRDDRDRARRREKKVAAAEAMDELQHRPDGEQSPCGAVQAGDDVKLSEGFGMIEIAPAAARKRLPPLKRWMSCSTAQTASNPHAALYRRATT